MIRSMTGFGRATAERQGYKLDVAIKTLNSKQVDISMRLPTRYRMREVELRSRAARLIGRGKIEIVVLLDNHLSPGVGGELFNSTVMQAYLAELQTMSTKLDIPMPTNVMQTLLSMPGVFHRENDGDSNVSDEEWQLLNVTLDEAIDQLDEFRRQEGEMLARVFTESIEAIRSSLRRIDEIDPLRIEGVRTRIKAGLEKLRGESYDTGRLEQEILFYIERLDVSEEKNRLQNHLDYFIATMSADGDQGKKLGFIAQEIGREVNTIGSKSNFTEMQQLVVKMKDELEQIKEQVLNTL